MVQDLYNLIILSGTSNSNLVYSEVHTLRSNYFLRFDNLLYSTYDYGKNEVLFVKIAATITKIPSVPKNSGLSQIQLCCPEVPISEILSRIFKISLICPEPLYKLQLYCPASNISTAKNENIRLICCAFS